MGMNGQMLWNTERSFSRKWPSLSSMSLSGPYLAINKPSNHKIYVHLQRCYPQAHPTHPWSWRAWACPASAGRVGFSPKPTSAEDVVAGRSTTHHKEGQQASNSCIGMDPWDDWPTPPHSRPNYCPRSSSRWPALASSWCSQDHLPWEGIWWLVESGPTHSVNWYCHQYFWIHTPRESWSLGLWLFHCTWRLCWQCS